MHKRDCRLYTRQIPLPFRDFITRLFLTAALVSPAACGGGGGEGSPAPWPSQTISGTVVMEGKPTANAEVLILCANGSSSDRYYITKTDASGAWSKSVDTAVAPCLLQATSISSATGSPVSLLSYVRALEDGRAIANVSPLTSAIVAMTSAGLSMSTPNLYSMDAQIKLGKDVANWESLRKQLSSLTSLNLSADLNAMAGDPVSSAIQVTSAASTPTGHYALLQKLAAARMGVEQLRALAEGQRYAEAPGTGGAEVQDLRTQRVWQRCVLGMVWTGTTCTGTPSLLTRAEATTVVAALPKSIATGLDAARAGWYVPSYDDLRNLGIMPTTGSSTLDPNWFPADPGGPTWSAQRAIGPDPKVRIIYTLAFNTKTGEKVYGTDTDKFYVRAFR